MYKKKMKNKNILLKEFDFLHSKPGRKFETFIEPAILDELEQFVLQNEDHGQYLKLTTRKGFGKVLQAQSYVGAIQTKDGTTIEILPKIANLDDSDNEIETTRQIVIKMLKTLKNSPFKSLNRAHLKSTKMPLFEIFIAMFLEELAQLVRKGIRSAYLPKKENLKFLKGKLLISEHLKKNYIHKEHFYVAYDEYSANRVENRLIKTTLQYLYKKSKSSSNQKRIREFLFVFDEIDPSYTIEEDFKNVKHDRQMKAYRQTLLWCKTFLSANSFSPYKGSSIAFALLFDMNMLFESYVYHRLKKDGGFDMITAQDTGKYLVYKSGMNPKFKLKPDIVIGKNTDNVIIIDTKWKILSEEKSNQGVSQADLYQLFAYGTKYKSKTMFLIYPLGIIPKENGNHYNYYKQSSDCGQIDLKILFFNLRPQKEMNDWLIDQIRQSNRKKAILNGIK